MSRGCQEAPEAILPEIHGTCVILYFKDRLPVLIVECCLKFICHHRHIEIRGTVQAGDPGGGDHDRPHRLLSHGDGGGVRGDALPRQRGGLFFGVHVCLLAAHGDGCGKDGGADPRSGLKGAHYAARCRRKREYPPQERGVRWTGNRSPVRGFRRKARAVPRARAARQNGVFCERYKLYRGVCPHEGHAGKRRISLRG